MSSCEILDVVSADDQVLGQEQRSIIYQKNLFFRVINAFVCNDEKKLWIPRRHAQKKLFPLHLDCSVGGHVLTGESYHDAFIRETKEEINIDINQVRYKQIARLTPPMHGVSAFMYVYLIYSNDVPHYNTNDFIDYYWLSPQEVFEKLANNDKAKSDLPHILKAIKEQL
jgi:isopentenyl-diphosphate delta-isomerase